MHRNSPFLTLIGWGSLVLQVGGFCFEPTTHPVQKIFSVKKLHKKPRTLYTKDSQTEHGNRNKIRNLRIGTWNIRTLYKSGSMNVVINKITKYNLSIVTLQEIRWPGNGSFKHKGTTVFYSGCKDNKHAFGV